MLQRAIGFSMDKPHVKQRVGIIGLGYVGLPLALTFARAGHTVVGFDIDRAKIDAIRACKSYIRHVPDAALAKASGFTVADGFDKLADVDAVLMCVPTPLNRNREPDMSFVHGTAREVARHLKPGHLIVLESTTYPGTTAGIVRDLLEVRSLKAGHDFYLAYSPEREDPGNPHFDTQRIPKVVGGYTPTCLGVALALYGGVFDRVVPVSSTTVAEMTKLHENIFRCVNIALANEMKVLCEAMGIDVWEVIHAASTKPFGFMPFFPGPGLGGHCIPIDPFYLTWKAREYHQTTRFIELSGEINSRMPEYVVERTALALNQHYKSFRGSSILIVGVAYKPDVDDMRESPALRIIELLQERGAFVTYYDPYVPTLPRTRKTDLQMESAENLEASALACDVAVIVTDHSVIDFHRLAQAAPMIVDTRNATCDLAPDFRKARVVRA